LGDAMSNLATKDGSKWALGAALVRGKPRACAGATPSVLENFFS
jgi:hypothetical protein